MKILISTNIIMASLIKEVVKRLYGLSVCSRCIVLFIEGNHGADKVLEWTDNKIDNHVKYLLPSSTVEPSDIIHREYICPCCLDTMKQDHIVAVAKDIVDKVNHMTTSTNMTITESTNSSDPITLAIESVDYQKVLIALDVVLPPIFDLLKVIYRIVSSQHTEKTVSFPSYNDIIKLRLSSIIKELTYEKVVVIDQEEDAKFKVVLNGSIPNQGVLCKTFFGDRFSMKKRRREMNEDDNVIIDEEDIVKVETEKMINMAKKFSKKDICELFDFLMRERDQRRDTIIKCLWKEPLCHRTCGYVLGRYKKLSRDVPQSPWMIGDERKGRLSIEEIISEAISTILKTNDPTKLHGCGREDIDVRCLGNGRPFVLEVSKYIEDINEVNLSLIVDRINSGQGLNGYHDIEVMWMTQTPKSTWENMQEVAEEKKKAYCCLIWTEAAINTDQLRHFELLASREHGQGRDEEGRPCLEIAQKTPLRVLHRRSLLTRPRYIYDIDTVVLNPHYFILKLTTSSGTYVKEFVHGDLGRTEPSVGSIFNCKADILQLDVVGLFDEFEGGWHENITSTDNKSVENVTQSLEKDSKVVNELENRELSWNDMKKIPIASWKRRDKQ